MRRRPPPEDSEWLWAGARVRWIGPDSTLAGTTLNTGDLAEVVHAGRYQLPSFGGLSTHASSPPREVLITAGGAVVDVERRHLEIVAPDHPLRPESDGERASWVIDALVTPAGGERWTVAGIIPDRFEAVVRVDHRSGEEGEFEGEMDPATAATLVEILGGETATPDDITVAVWVGFGDTPPQMYPGAAIIQVPHREYFLLRGPIEGVLAATDIVGYSDTARPALWWPADRRWVVATEIDFSWTFVASSEELAQRLLATNTLTTVRTSPSASAT